MFFRAPLVYLLGLASASAFLLPTPAARPSTQLWAQKDALFKTADRCLDGECSIEDVDDLLMELRKTIRVLETELREVKKYEKTLTELNRGPARDDLKEIIKAVVRAFDVDPEDLDFPQISNPAGFSGEPFKGGKTRFDGVPVANFKAK